MGIAHTSARPRTRQTILGLSVVVSALLWATNPTLDGYQASLERRLHVLAAQMDPAIQGQERRMVKRAVTEVGHRLVAALVKDHTRRYSLGVASVYVTEVGEIHMTGLGIARLVIPLQGHDEGMLAIGRLIFRDSLEAPQPIQHASLVTSAHFLWITASQSPRIHTPRSLPDIHRVSQVFTVNAQHFVLKNNRNRYI